MLLFIIILNQNFLALKKIQRTLTHFSVKKMPVRQKNAARLMPSAHIHFSRADRFSRVPAALRAASIAAQRLRRPSNPCRRKTLQAQKKEKRLLRHRKLHHKRRFRRLMPLETKAGYLLKVRLYVTVSPLIISEPVTVKAELSGFVTTTSFLSFTSFQ